MNDRPHLQHQARVSTWTLGLVAACLLLALSVLFVGCGDSSSATDTTEAGTATTAAGTATGESVPSTAAPESMGPSEFVDGLVADWSEAIQKLNTLLESRPEPGAVRSQVESLKEEYIQKFLVYGQQKEAMSNSDKSQVDSAAFTALVATEDTEWYAAYMANWQHYSDAGGDLEFTNLLADFNILTQYADFELLKTQDPEEAARLGIE